jgi:hypothetical protein
MLKIFIYISIWSIGAVCHGFGQTETFDATLKRHEQAIKELDDDDDPQAASDHSFFEVGDGKNQRAYLGTSDTKGGLFLLKDGAGKVKVNNYTDDDGGLVNILNSSGHVVSQLFASKEGGVVDVNDNSGTTAAQLSVDKQGKGTLFLLGKAGMDIAEQFEAFDQQLLPGTVASIAPGGKLSPSKRAYDPTVVGVITGAGSLSPAISLGQEAPASKRSPIAIAGQVYVRVCLESGPISPGDLLAPSSRQGVAMRAANRKKSFGSVIGKALEGFDSRSHSQQSEGLLRMLVMEK